jgi:hypothetical protein
MKFTDDYNAKYKIWAADPKPQPEIPAPPLPKFSPQRFSSWEDFNQWKRALLLQAAIENAAAAKR